VAGERHLTGGGINLTTPGGQCCSGRAGTAAASYSTTSALSYQNINNNNGAYQYGIINVNIRRLVGRRTGQGGAEGTAHLLSHSLYNCCAISNRRAGYQLTKIWQKPG